MKKTTVIPKSNVSISGVFPKSKKVERHNMLFSFELLDFSVSYYNCNGMCDKGIKNCFEKLRDYSGYTVDELHAGRGGETIRFHFIKRSDVDEWPEYFTHNQELEDSFYQISFGKSKGRAHGVLIGNVFYIIWLDPHHFLYHNRRYGIKRAFRELEDCCTPRDDIISCYERRIEKLEKENIEYEKLLDQQTSPLK
jgi:hypothetical protein